MVSGTANRSRFVRPAGTALGLLLMCGQASAGMCDSADLAGLRTCSDKHAATLIGDIGWMGCDGSCVISENAGGVSVMNLQLEVTERFSETRFLPGNGDTRNLAILPLLSADGNLVLIDANSLQTTGNLSLSGVVDGNPATMPRFVEEARGSVDGRRFFVPSPDGPGFTTYEIAGDRFEPIQRGHPAMLISPSGRYGLTVDPQGDGTFTCMNYVSGTSFATRIRFEIDTPFFDVDERFLLRRHRYKAGLRLSAYSLSTGVFVTTVAWPEDASLNVRVTQEKRGLLMTDLSPPE